MDKGNTRDALFKIAVCKSGLHQITLVALMPLCISYYEMLPCLQARWCYQILLGVFCSTYVVSLAWINADGCIIELGIAIGGPSLGLKGRSKSSSYCLCIEILPKGAC
eukprot:Gb_11969 [translate_table: standard]